MKKLILLMGVSGSGKTTLTTEILNTYSQLVLVPSYTSRPMRDNEKNGRKYRHISDQKFRDMISNGEFLEYAEVHNKYLYGTKLSDIHKAFDRGQIPIKEMDTSGLEKIKKDSKGIDFVSIFLDIPDNMMIERIKSRGNIYQEEIDRRIASAQIERIKANARCDYILDASGTIKENLDKINDILKKIIK